MNTYISQNLASAKIKYHSKTYLQQKPKTKSVPDCNPKGKAHPAIIQNVDDNQRTGSFSCFLQIRPFTALLFPRQKTPTRLSTSRESSIWISRSNRHPTSDRHPSIPNQHLSLTYIRSPGLGIELSLEILESCPLLPPNKLFNRNDRSATKKKLSRLMAVTSFLILSLFHAKIKA